MRSSGGKVSEAALCLGRKNLQEARVSGAERVRRREGGEGGAGRAGPCGLRRGLGFQLEGGRRRDGYGQRRDGTGLRCPQVCFYHRREDRLGGKGRIRGTSAGVG